MSRLVDASRVPVCVAVYRRVVDGMTGREFRQWYADSRAISGREFYEGRP